jgi:hypothetical protein
MNIKRLFRAFFEWCLEDLVWHDSIFNDAPESLLRGLEWVSRVLGPGSRYPLLFPDVFRPVAVRPGFTIIGVMGRLEGVYLCFVKKNEVRKPLEQVEIDPSSLPPPMLVNSKLR